MKFSKQKQRKISQRFGETSKLYIFKAVLYQVNTMRADFVSQGMNHAEGGWPKVLGSHESTRRNQL